MPDEKQIIAVTGATGNIGRPVVEGLIALGYRPRAVVRKRKPVADWDGAGVEQVVVEDGADTLALTRAFAGAARIFSVSPLAENLVEIGEAHVEAARRAGVKWIVRSSAQGAGPGSPITMGRWHGAVETTIEKSGLDFTIVQPASFFQNYLGYADTIRNQNAFYLPMGDGKVSLIDARDIAAVAVAALTGDGHAGKKYPVTGGESLSNHDIARTLGEVLDREIRYVDLPDDQARRRMLDSKMPEWMVGMMMELNGVSKAGYAAAVLPGVKEVTGREPRTFRQFAAENRSAFRGAAKG